MPMQRSRLSTPDWLFRLVFGPIVVLALVVFVWFISRNEPPPKPGRLEVQMQEEVQSLIASNTSVPVLTRCRYSAKTFAIYTCTVSAAAEGPLRAALRQGGWSLAREDSERNSGKVRMVEYSRKQEAFAIYCYSEANEFRFDYAHYW